MWEQQPLWADRRGESEGPALEIGGPGGLSCPTGHRSWVTWERRRTGGLGGPGPGSSFRQPLHTNTPPWFPGRGEGTWDPPSAAGWPALPRAVLGSQGGSHLAAPRPPFPYARTVDSTDLPAGFAAHSHCLLSSPSKFGISFSLHSKTLSPPPRGGDRLTEVKATITVR
ncbi:unnamed protein product [Rangifer tarandus platyrhynchus]|uniref:Uncharacterized protein n=2 Tax=Rangifer tarandus platyrhynchus TaxID=3082113 RepID=A0ABN8XVW3_RANTA|nr:unnamed protein product [Rangifer tarandus platyrhynchus]CAI9692316.1 unnamed protein product [Rangifer tarandus platyrhynchus]